MWSLPLRARTDSARAKCRRSPLRKFHMCRSHCSKSTSMKARCGMLRRAPDAELASSSKKLSSCSSRTESSVPVLALAIASSSAKSASDVPGSPLFGGTVKAQASRDRVWPLVTVPIRGITAATTWSQTGSRQGSPRRVKERARRARSSRRVCLPILRSNDGMRLLVSSSSRTESFARAFSSRAPSRTRKRRAFARTSRSRKSSKLAFRCRDLASASAVRASSRGLSSGQSSVAR
mmetsp:Transcript_1633/g.5015  ORF Transcript_1633/g.5015 Transcript_1633/m.5015 type:complete len:235 (-) Transcript_1633:124-828(-)